MADFNSVYKMTPKPEEIWICNIDRTQELSRRINKRRYPDAKMSVNIAPRAVQTQRVHFPMLDSRKVSNVNMENRGVFDNEKIFSPGDSAPFNGFASKIDDESNLKNIIYPIQDGFQSKYIPNMTSDLFMNHRLVAGRNEVNPHTGLFEEHEYFTKPPCYRDQIGTEIFNNCTKVQIKNIKI
tara:strand:- start:157 stop:702 length:546 start_codon:yes stop_codon:yes gene_type:complete